jgi:ATP synthase protein I
LEQDLKNILKSVAKIDIFIAIIALILSFIFYRPYTYVVAIGLAMAIINFVLNAVTTSYLLSIGGKKASIIISSAIRVIITVVIILLLYNNNKYNIVAFIVGYTLHYVSVVIHGVRIKK